MIKMTKAFKEQLDTAVANSTILTGMKSMVVSLSKDRAVIFGVTLPPTMAAKLTEESMDYSVDLEEGVINAYTKVTPKQRTCSPMEPQKQY